MTPNLLDELEGYVLVPIRPTPEMLDRAVYAQEPNMGVNRGGSNNANRLRRRALRIYEAMLQGAIREQEVALSPTGAPQSEAVGLETGAETEPAQGGTRTKLATALADMAKRMEAAERDAARYRWLCEFREWPESVEGALDCGNKAVIDAAIDATQEGAG